MIASFKDGSDIEILEVAKINATSAFAWRKCSISIGCERCRYSLAKYYLATYWACEIFESSLKHRSIHRDGGWTNQDNKDAGEDE